MSGQAGRGSLSVSFDVLILVGRVIVGRTKIRCHFVKKVSI